MRPIRLIPLLPLLVAAGAVATPAGAAVCTPTVQWVWDGPTRSPDYPEACITPLVVELTDDNGDGRIDVKDNPDVVFTHSSRASYSALITAVDGATGAEHWTTSTPDVMPTALAAGDIDGDGTVEILAIDDLGQHLVAFENDGTPKWTSAPSPVPLYEFDAMGIADLDQDGSPEIFVGASVWNADGSFRWQGLAGSGTEGYWSLINISHAADLLPANPGLELLAGNTLYDSGGTVLWQNLALPDGWTAVADFDLDGDPEIVLTTTSAVYLLDHLGNPIGSPHSMPGILISQPIAADLDGDGVPEVLAIQGYQVDALEVGAGGLSLKWTVPVNDGSRVTGASTYDLDGDGAAEVLYHDEDQWYIFDGRTGATLSQLPFPSATSIETPVVADIDHDCVAEILVSGCEGGLPYRGPQQVIAYECSGSPSARPLWNEFGYHVTNVNDDGTIPRVETAPWLAQNSWIGQVGGAGALVAAAGPDVETCGAGGVLLDGSASSACGSGATRYRWVEGSTVVCDWSDSPTCSVTPAVSPATYTLEVECAGPTGCAPASDTVTVVAVTPPAAAAGPDRQTCAGTPALLDASASSGCGTLPRRYRWRDGATVACDWSPSPQCSVAPAAPAAYTVDVECVGQTACASSSDSVAIAALTPPAAAAGPDVRACAASPVTLDGAASPANGCPGGALTYEWRAGATVLRPASPTPTWAPPTANPGTSNYTLAVACVQGPRCETTDEVAVTIVACPLAVRFAGFEAVPTAAGVEVRWQTLAETDTYAFRVESAPAEAGPFAAAGAPVPARGPGYAYRFLDEKTPADAARWYRVVELTGDGRGDQTRPFTLRDATPDASAGGRAQRTRRRVRTE